MKAEMQHRFRSGKQMFPMKPQKLFNFICNNKCFLPNDPKIDSDTLDEIIKEVVEWWFNVGLKQVALGSGDAVISEDISNPKEDLSNGMHTLQHFNRNVIKTRDYQRQIFEKAKSKNVIAFMPTGSGKTRIAIKLIEYHLKKIYLNTVDLTRNGEEVNRKLIIFLVCTTHLAEQQRGAIYKALPFIKIRKIIGADSPDSWSKKDWDIELNHYDVLVMMHDCLIVAMTHGFITMQEIDLLIFDGTL